MAAAFASIGLRNKAPSSVVVALYEVGHPWMIAYVYLLLVFLLVDVAVLCRILPKVFLKLKRILRW